VAGRIRSIEKFNDLIRNLPVCSTEPQPTTLLRAPDGRIILKLILNRVARLWRRTTVNKAVINLNAPCKEDNKP
jgi:hypothetical protein